MGNEHILYDDGSHKCVMFSIDDESNGDSYLSVNQFLIVQNGYGVLIDPGSASIFDEMCDAVSRHVNLENIKFIFFSHQDPDVAGSIAEWSIATSAKFIMSALWVRFMSHYGLSDLKRIIALEDKGAKLAFGHEHLRFIPSHFMHSPGNFSLYDSKSKILFSGDIGAAIVDVVDGAKEVANFDEHVKHLAPFHKRYMASNRATKAWVEHLGKYDIDMIAPQHGLVFTGESKVKFLEWLGGLKCGLDLIEELY